mgnify:FL=1|jgi:hypothetical protein|tara:strand:- start:2366 stop:3061 length:696 start_codon:yes stop_codon:yes gene_type:complete
MSWLKKFDLKTILIMALCVVLLMRGCGNDDTNDIETVEVDGKDYGLIKQTIDTVFVTKEVKVPTYIPKYITKVETVEVQIPIDIDTLAIVEKYFSTYQVKDTLNLSYEFPLGVTDSLGNKPSPNLGFGIITDNISQNSIISRDVDWTFQIPTIYNTSIVKELPKTQLYWGLNGGFNREDVITNISGSLLLKTKKDKIFQLGLGVQNNSNIQQLSPYISAGMYWKISLGKKK